jgi:Tol biopolymer transport system component
MRHVVSAVFGSLLLSSASFAAKPPPPPPPQPPSINVAYRLPDGKGTKLVVSTESGASQMTLYRLSGGSFTFDLAPRGQQQIAIVDGPTGVLKLLSYDLNTSGVYVPGTIEILEPSGVTGPVDFNPDGSKVAYSCCGNSGTRQIIVQDVSTHEKIPWAEGSHFFDISWFRGGTSIVYSTAIPLAVREVTAPMAQPQLLYSTSPGQTLDVESARTNPNRLVISLNDSGTGRIGLWENGGFINADLANSNKSWQGTLDCTDTKLAYMGVQNSSGSQAFYIRDLNSGGTTLVSRNSNILLQFWPTC